jgi:hypothetical protein
MPERTETGVELPPGVRGSGILLGRGSTVRTGQSPKRPIHRHRGFHVNNHFLGLRILTLSTFPSEGLISLCWECYADGIILLAIWVITGKETFHRGASESRTWSSGSQHCSLRSTTISKLPSFPSPNKISPEHSSRNYHSVNYYPHDFGTSTGYTFHLHCSWCWFEPE